MAVIIFDLDGTLADSFDYVADFLAGEAGLPPLSRKQKAALRGLSMTAMARQLGYHWWDAPRLFFKGRRRMHKAIKEWHAFAEMPALIRKLHKEGHRLFVLSTNSPRNVRYFLRSQHIYKYFVAVHGGAGVFNKAPDLRRLLKSHSIPLEQAVYVGDELRDIEAAKAAGLRAVAVSWGFAGRDNLKAAQPAALADTPAQLMKILEKI